MHNQCIGRYYWQKRQQHGHHPILRMSGNGASIIFSFASWIIYVPIGYRHPFIAHWLPLLRKLQWHAPCHILGMSAIRVSLILSFSSGVIYVPTGSSHPFIKYWQPLLAKTTATCSLPHPEKKRQQSVNSFSCCIFRNQDITQIFPFITELITALICKTTIHQR